MVFALVVGDFLTPQLIGGASGVTVISAIADLFGAAFDWPLGSAIAWTLLAAMVAWWRPSLLLVRRTPWGSVMVGGASRAMERVLKSYVGLVYAFMYLPVAVVALFSFNSAEMMAFPMTGLHLVWYDVAIHDSRLLGGLANSVLIAAPTALISTTLGAMAALALTRHRFRGQDRFRLRC